MRPADVVVTGSAATLVVVLPNEVGVAGSETMMVVPFSANPVVVNANPVVVGGNPVVVGGNPVVVALFTKEVVVILLAKEVVVALFAKEVVVG